MTAEAELQDLSACRMVELIAKGDLSPTETVQHSLARIEAVNDTVGAFITVCAEEAIHESRERERAVARGDELGPLHGVPVSIKDHLFTRGIRTTGGSLAHREFVPRHDASAVKRLRDAGAVIVGKTNVPEFNLHTHTFNRLGVETRNPWDLERTPGGSSGGAAAGLACGVTPIAVGSDDGGSIRLPAAFCGVFGLLPGAGVVVGGENLAGTTRVGQVGPMSRYVSDAAVLLAVLSGAAPRRHALDALRSQVGSEVQGLRLAYASTGDEDEISVQPGVAAVVRHAVDALAVLGARVEPIRLPFPDVTQALRVISGVERYATIGRLYEDPSSRSLLTPAVVRRLADMGAVSRQDYAHALSERDRVIRELAARLSGYDALLTPTVAFTAPRIADLPNEYGGRFTAFTRLANFVGFPAASVPCGFVDGLPVGLQVLGRPGTESTLLRISAAVESDSATHATAPDPSH
jgi:Asp-tRNA(Asn)/Glu-tRNA(Gln) amidotransferase A subunit family amidase